MCPRPTARVLAALRHMAAHAHSAQVRGDFTQIVSAAGFCNLTSILHRNTQCSEKAHTSVSSLLLKAPTSMCSQFLNGLLNKLSLLTEIETLPNVYLAKSDSEKL